MKRSLFIFLTLILSISFSVKAHDFYSVNSDGDTIYYNITSSTSPYTVAVTYKGSSATEYLDEYIDTISIPSTVLYNSITYSVTSIGNSAFHTCLSLKSVITTNSVTSIGNSAFNTCMGVKSVITTDSVTYIGESAFSDCMNLFPFTIPNFVNYIGRSAFYNCVRIKSFTIPSSATYIGDHAFNRCDSLISINVDTSNPNYSSNNGILYNKTLDTLICCPGGKLGIIDIPNSVTSIYNWAFVDCQNLTKINIPYSVTSIDYFAFQLCFNLDTIFVDNNNPNYSCHNGMLYNKNKDTLLYCPTARVGSVIIPDFVTVIYDNAFYVCNKITSLYISNSVISIGSLGIYECDSMRTLYIGSSVRYIGYLNFLSYAVPNLTSITCRAIIPPIMDNTTFGRVPRDIPVYVPCGSVQLYQSAQNWNTFTNYPNNYQINIYDTICEGDTYTDNGFNESIEGEYHKYHFTINDCDSTINLFLTVNSLPTNLSLEAESNNLILSWQGNNSTYVIYRNNDSIGTVSGTIYIDRNLVNGTNYCYKVKSINGYCESEEICKIFLGLNDIKDSQIEVNLYPNPTSDKATFELEGLKNDANVFIYDIMGKAIKNYKLNANQKSLEIELNGFASGIYNVKIINSDCNITKKLIVK